MKFVIAVVILVITFGILVGAYAKTEPLSLMDQNIVIVRLAFYAINDGDFASLADLHSPDYLQYSPDYKDPQTWSEFELACRIVHSRLPNLQYRIVDIFAFEDKVAVRSVWEYPRDPSWSRYRMAGINLSGSAISIFRIENGKIIEEWCEYDPAVIKRFCASYKSMSPNK